MVQIAPPADWPGYEAPPVAVVALLSPRVEPVFTLSTTASTIVPAEFAFDLPLAPTTPAVADVGNPLGSQTPATVLKPELAPTGSPILWWGLGSAAVFTVAALTYILWPSGAKEVAKSPPPVAQAPVPPSEKKPDAEPTAPAPTDKATSEPDPYAVDHSKDAVANVADSKPTEPPIANAAPAVTETPKTTGTVAATAPSAPVSPEMVKEAVAAATSVPPLTDRPDAAPSNAAAGAEHVLKFDPLDFDPEHLSLSSKPMPAGSQTVASTSSIPAEPPAEVPPKAVEEIKPAAADLLPAPEVQKAVNVKRGPVAGDDVRPLDTAQHLALKLKLFQVTEIPLARFVDTLSDMAGVPITLDPVTLELSGLSPRTPISANAADGTLETVLHDAFEKQRLELVDDDTRIAAALANADEFRAVDFEVKDLVSGNGAYPIAKLIEQFVAPQSWKANGGKGTIEVQGTNLHITQSLTARREALIFCERLRLARGLPLKSKFPAALLTVDSPYEKIGTTLNRPTTFTFLAWTPLADVLRQWQETSNITILVDWPALRDVEFTPATPVACSTIERPWTEALDGVLEPLGLGWWASDGQTIQITSRDALDRIERVEFYSVPKQVRDELGSGASVVAAIKKQIADNVGDKVNTDGPRIELDEKSGRLIVRATPAVQRYLSSKFAAAQK